MSNAAAPTAHLYRVVSLRADGTRHTHYFTCMTAEQALDCFHARSRRYPETAGRVHEVTPCGQHPSATPWKELPGNVPLRLAVPTARPLRVPACTGACNQGRDPCDCSTGRQPARHAAVVKTPPLAALSLRWVGLAFAAVVFTGYVVALWAN
jgi:hypothetical protein